MALRLLQPGTQPLGQFDGYDSQISSFLGGEIVTLVGVLLGIDKAAADVEGGGASDGYIGTGNKLRPVVTRNVLAGSRPLYLADEGVAHYGTLFGTVVGANVGQVVTGGTVLGPSTATGSGKITLWDKPGLYAVTLDAVDTDPVNGLMPSNGALIVGTAVQYTATGLLTTASNGLGTVVARLVEFATDGGLVITPNTLVAAVNSGGGPQKTQFTQAVIQFTPPL